MLLKYYSNWIFLLFILWIIGNIFNINSITKYINLYYATILTSIGYTLLLIYYIYYKKYKYDNSLLFILTLIHYIPLVISYKYSNRKYVKETLLITILMYMIYMIYINKNPYDVYIVNKHPNVWKEVYINCRLNKDKFSPICNILKLIKNI